jgi:hypothetical protein
VSRQRAFDASWMHAEAKSIAHLLGECGHAQGRFGFEPFVDKGHDGLGELVRTLGSLLGWQEPRHTRAFEGRSCLVEGRSGESKVQRGLTRRTAFFAHRPQHLVLHLDRVARIEEGIVLEQGVCDLLRVRMQCSPACELLVLGVVGQDGSLRVHQNLVSSLLRHIVRTRQGQLAEKYQ